VAAVAGASPRTRLIAVGLIAYGLIGLIVLAVVGTGVVGVLDRVQGLSTAFEQQRRSLTRALDTASITLGNAAETISGIDASLAKAELAVADAATLSNDVSFTMTELANALNVDILGSQPFAGVSGGFTRASTQLSALSIELTGTAGALGSNAEDAQAVGADLVRLQAAVDDLRDGIRDAPATGVSGSDLAMLRLVLIGLFIWLAVPALAGIAAGAWMWRRAPRAPEVAP
jgi:hypothetical protein